MLEIVEVRRNWLLEGVALTRLVAQCIGPSALAPILSIFAEEYGHRTGGIPDLWYASPLFPEPL